MDKFYTFCDRVGHRIFYRYVDENGKRRQTILSDYPFELFMKGSKSDSVSLYGDQISRVNFENVSEMSEFCKNYRGVSEIFGQTSPAHQFIAKEYTNKISFDLSKVVVLNFDIEVRHDDGFPEPEDANDEILSISMKVFGKDQRITLGLKPFKNNERPQDIYEHCSNERELLFRFLEYWKRINPDIITGWNIEGFDIPYLINRMRKIIGVEATNELSPFHKSTKNVFTEILTGPKKLDPGYRILGVNTFDYLKLYIKFAPKKLESYKLDFVAETELKENKTDLSRFNNDLMRLYNEDFAYFVTYNEQDVGLVERLDDKLQFIRLAISVVLMTKSRYSEALGTVKIWDNLIYNMLLPQNIQIPPSEYDGEDDEFVGAYVKEPIPGRYRWVVSMDLTSLYPSIIRMYNMSPETLFSGGVENPIQFLEKLLAGEWNLLAEARNNGRVTAANGSQYRQDKEGILAKAMTFLFEERKVVKKQMIGVKKEVEKLKADHESQEKIDSLMDKIAQLDALQQALKVVANGGYGAIANKAYRYFLTAIAEGITLTGQLTIRFISARINAFLNEKFGTNGIDYVITCDTDSAYICLDHFVLNVLKMNPDIQKQKIQKIVDCLDLFVKKEIEPMLEREYAFLAEMVGSKNNKMDMKREAIADVGIFRGKKNYIMQVYDNEGVRYTTPELKMVGIETAKSSTPKVVREKLKECLNIIVNGTNDELLVEISKFKAEFEKMPLSKIAFPRGVSDLEKWYCPQNIHKKSVPIHTRGALHFNNLINVLGLQNKYPPIRSGSKIKFIGLQIPNPLRSTSIAFVDELPPEFELENYIDIEGQFKVSFLNPVESFTKLNGWNIKKVNSLEDLFA